MPKMQVHPHPTDRHQVILGPCPGCDLWTLQYDRVEVVSIFLNTERFHSHVEGLLQEHLAECKGLQEIVDTL